MSLRKIKMTALGLIYRLLETLLRPTPRVTKQTLLLVRLDAIGDYLLFRNFFESLKGSRKYAGYQITLLGNVAWKDLCLNLDSEVIDKFIWIDTTRFEGNPLYRLRIMREIVATGYEVILNPVFSRSYYSSDWIVKNIRAGQKIGSSGNLSNMSLRQKNTADKWYTKLIPATTDIVFEFDRNRQFIEQVIESEVDLRIPRIESMRGMRDSASSRYAILFVGASAKWRKWPISSFVRVACFLCDQFEMKIILAGGAADVADSNEFENQYRGAITNLVGKTSLVELMNLIAGAQLLVSNETSAPHFAVAVGTPVIVLYNGNHYGRFVPYPSDVAYRYRAAYHPLIVSDFADYKKRSNELEGVRNLDIREISVESVEAQIDALLERRPLSSSSTAH